MPVWRSAILLQNPDLPGNRPSPYPARKRTGQGPLLTPPAGEKVRITVTRIGVELAADTAGVVDVHVKQVEELDPRLIDPSSIHLASAVVVQVVAGFLSHHGRPFQ